MHRVIIAMEMGLLPYTTVATLCCWRINVKRWSVHPPGFTLQNNIDCFIACGASTKGGFMDDEELMLKMSYGKLLQEIL
jgi:hypothetical protein